MKSALICGISGQVTAFNRAALPEEIKFFEAVFEVLLVNALVRRDYFISAHIKLLIFSDRVELASPGHLPNHLTIEQIRYGLSNMRNPLLVLHATHLLPYRGLGSGIPRALNLDSSVDRLLSSLNRYEH